MTDWPLAIDGREHHPIPATWLDHGSDEGYGSPRCYAVSVARSTRDLIRIRYVARDGGVYVQSTSSKPNPTGEGVVPASLASVHDWPRSIVPPSHVEPADTARDPERERLQAVWSERVDGLEAERERELVADGGSDRLYLGPDDLLAIALEQSEHDRQRELIREAMQVGRTPPACGGWSE